MIRDRGDGGGKVEIQLAVLGVAGDLCLGIIEQVLREVVDRVLGNVVTGQNDRADRNRGHIAVGAVNIGGDDVLGVVVRRCAEAFDVLVVKGNEVDVLGGGEVSDGGRGSAGDDEGRIDLAVLDALGVVERAARSLPEARAGAGDGGRLAEVLAVAALQRLDELGRP